MIEKLIERFFKTPAVVLDQTVDTTKGIIKKVRNQTPLKKARAYWKILGPGLTTGAADDDPSGIATYSQAGAQYGFQLLWLAWFTFPLMAVVQEMCARIGLITGRGLAANIKAYYPKWALYTCAALLFMANSFNIGADLAAMAAATQLVIPRASFSLLVVAFTAFSLVLQIFMSYRQYARYLKWLTLVLFSYVLTAFSIHMDWKQVLQHAVMPSFSLSKEQMFLITAVLGTTISPYLFFWQASQECEEQQLKAKTTAEAKPKSLEKQIRRIKIDVWSGMFFSNAVMFFIIAVCAATLFSHGITNISSAADAAAALRPLAGEQAFLLFALGIIGTGLLALPILAGSASYALSESFNWVTGLDRKLNEASTFYGVIIVSMTLGLLLGFTEINPIKALVYSAVANALVAPVVLIFIVLISSNRRVMGNNANKAVTKGLGWLITGIMIVSGLATIVSVFI
jgi:NRAMP (natural resistance-associated macrophage protein)-like metal ion transporter